ncbi:MAG: type II secretion system F family protein [Gemmataceae bacterium]|nr:type II secretion system F family protein [Gemmataceae bacterium]
MADQMLLSLGSAATAGAVAAGYERVADLTDWLNRRTGDGIARRMKSVGMDVTVLPAWLRLWRGLTLATFLGWWFFAQSPPLAVSLAFLVQQLGPLWFDVRVEARRKLVNEQTANAARKLAGQVRVGMPFGEALQAVAAESPAPLGLSLRRATQQLDQGKSVRDALADLRQNLRTDAIALLTSALLVASESGGKLADLLDKISLSLDEFQRVQRKRESDTASGRLMVRIMAVFPVGFFAFFYGTAPDQFDKVLTTLPGQLVLATAIVLTYVSIRWARHILARKG